jgi:tetratricopeptide (TPR) repeat protein
MPDRLLFVAWASADWQVALPLAESGALPHLARLIDGGVMADLATVEPTLPAPLWTTLASGVPADVHGLLSCVEPASTDAIRPVTRHSWQAPALWDHAASAGRRCIVVGWPFTHPAGTPANGAMVSDLFCAGDEPLPSTVQPSEVWPELRQLRVRAGEMTAAELQPLVPRLDRIDLEADTRPALIARLLADAFSLHAVSTWLMEHHAWDLGVVCCPTLEGFSHAFMAYHPRQLAGVEQTDFDLYHRVVAGAYRIHDMMLGRLIELAGPDACVMLASDHGFHCGARRPAPHPPRSQREALRWHRAQGMLCVRGPGVRRDERIYGASVLNVVPTALAVLGLRAPGLPGRVLDRLFERPPEASTPAAGYRAEIEATGDEAQPLLESYAQRGWIDVPLDGAADASLAAARVQQLVLARVHLAARRFADASALLSQVLDRFPDDPDALTACALARLALGDLPGCRSLVERGERTAPAAPMWAFLTGLLLSAEGRPADALAALERVDRRTELPAGFSTELGRLYLQLDRAADAERAFQDELQADGGNAQALQGLSVAFLMQNQVSDAVEAVTAAIAWQHEYPEAHFQLALALLRQGQPLRAARSLETCLALAPGAAQPHRLLATIHERHTGNLQKADEHRRRADALEHRPMQASREGE